MIQHENRNFPANVDEGLRVPAVAARENLLGWMVLEPIL